VVVAVASRERERARQFIERCQSDSPMTTVPQAFGSYEELLASKTVDAVYVPLPTGLRKEWVLRAAAAGKHVVCEKPCAPNRADLEEMIEACRRHGVQFIDGVMFMHSQRLGRMRQVLDDPETIGSIRRITSAFTFCAPPEFFTDNIRARPALEPHGCLGDLGWYCIRLSLWAVRWHMPYAVVGRILAQNDRPQNPTPVVTEFSGELLFQDGASAGFYCSFLAQNEEWAHVSGTKGCLHVEDFVVPFSGRETAFQVHNHQFLKSGCEFKMEPHETLFTVDEHSHGHATAQESNLFREFSNQVRSGRLNDEWPEFALKTQFVMDACLDSARRNSCVTSLE
jgi:predicted dehydrogenase